MQHGISFYDAIELFEGSYYQYPYDRDTERRIVAVGIANGRMIAIVYTLRGETYRVISARAARTSERKHYGENNKNND